MSRQNVVWIILSNIWWRLKENAQLLSVLVSTLVLITMAWSVYQQTEFNKFQKSITQAGFEPSVDAALIPVEKGGSLRYIVSDPESGLFSVKYAIRNLGTKYIYKVVAGSLASLQSSLDPKRTQFERETKLTSDLAPGAELIRYSVFSVLDTVLRNELPFWLNIRVSFQDAIGREFHYFKSYPFNVYNVTAQEGRIPGESLWVFSVGINADIQADWSRLLPGDSLK